MLYLHQYQYVLMMHEYYDDIVDVYVNYVNHMLYHIILMIQLILLKYHWDNEMIIIRLMVYIIYIFIYIHINIMRLCVLYTTKQQKKEIKIYPPECLGYITHISVLSTNA